MSARRREKDKNVSVAAKINFELKRVEPLNRTQSQVFAKRDMHQILHGSAGTGKTFLAMYLALDDVLNRAAYRKVVIFRSAVPSRNMGFMPGNDKEKAKLYEEPYAAICTELFDRGDAYDYLKQRGIVEFKTTSYVRGVTLDNAVIIVDELQNLTAHELHSVVTRLGKDCRLVISGDIMQNDLQQTRERSGAADMMTIAKRMDSFALIEFGFQDIVRSDFVKEYIIARHRLESASLVEPL